MSEDDPGLLSAGQVARIYGVDPKTVTRWARLGRIPCIETPGGHRRYRLEDLEPALRTTGWERVTITHYRVVTEDGGIRYSISTREDVRAEERARGVLDTAGGRDCHLEVWEQSFLTGPDEWRRVDG